MRDFVEQEARITGRATAADAHARYDRRREAQQLARICGQCGCDIAPGADVWIVLLERGSSAPGCRECALRSWRWSESYQWRSFNVACQHCGRTIHNPPSNKPPTAQRSHCCTQCAQAVRNRRRDAWRADERQKTCIICGEPFEATRRDAVTCSSKCRQQHYRNRKQAARTYPSRHVRRIDRSCQRVN